MKYPEVIATSVIRSAHQGQSHGGLYAIDLELGTSRLLLDWNQAEIDWEGRGGDRGLRGIVIVDDHIWIAASDEIFVFDRAFRRVASYRNRYLRHCHEMNLRGRRLYVTSTGFDSVLVFDLDARRFVEGTCVRYEGFGQAQLARLGGRMKPHVSRFDPDADGGPHAADTTHVNHVWPEADGFWCSGTRLGHLLRIRDGEIVEARVTPHGTHNARPWGTGTLANLTKQDEVGVLDAEGNVLRAVQVPVYPEDSLEMHDLPRDHARQGFGRGLAVMSAEGEAPTVIVGSSPATISVISLAEQRILKSVNITLDVRNAIHGLEILPESFLDGV